VSPGALAAVGSRRLRRPRRLRHPPCCESQPRRRRRPRSTGRRSTHPRKAPYVSARQHTHSLACRTHDHRRGRPYRVRGLRANKFMGRCERKSWSHRLRRNVRSVRRNLRVPCSFSWDDQRTGNNELDRIMRVPSAGPLRITSVSSYGDLQLTDRTGRAFTLDATNAAHPTITATSQTK